MFLLVLAAAIAGGTLLAAHIEPRGSLFERLALGTALGVAIQSLLGFVLASWWGLTPLVVGVTAVASVLIPYVWMSRVSAAGPGRARKKRRGEEVSVAAPSAPIDRALLAYFTAFAVFFWLFFGRAAYMKDGALMTGEYNNYGDLGVHLGIITGFVKGEGFPPEHTEMAGTRLTYPFLVDFGAALLVAAGAEMPTALFVQNMALALALLGMLYRWALALAGNRRAAFLAPVLFFFSGGLGFVTLLVEAEEAGLSLAQKLEDLPHSYTILWGDWGDVLRWGNPLTTLLITQRAFLLGLPLALAVWMSWWQAVDPAEPRMRSRRLLSAGLLTGLMPLTHAHSFLVLMGMGACLALLYWRLWRDWLLFFAAATIVALPQIAWSTRGAGASAGKFVAWHYGWAMPRDGSFTLAEFWAINLGLSLLGIWALLASRRMRLFLAPFLLCLIVPNVVRLAPWEWDNIKVLLYGYLALLPPLALLLARLLVSGAAARALGLVLLVVLTLSGAVDVWRVVGRTQEIAHFGPEVIAQARMIEQVTHPRARILTSQSVSRPTLLTGRRSVIGASFHIWTHGMDAAQAEQDVRQMYGGGPESEALLRRYRVDYVLVGSIERAELGANEAYFSQFPKVGEAGGASLHRVPWGASSGAPEATP